MRTGVNGREQVGISANGLLGVSRRTRRFTCDAAFKPEAHPLRPMEEGAPAVGRRDAWLCQPLIRIRCQRAGAVTVTERRENDGGAGRGSGEPSSATPSATAKLDRNLTET